MNDQPDTPNARDPGEDYRKGLEIYLAYLPRELQAEAAARLQYDPERVAQQQGLQEFFGPTQYRQQLDALHQLDPESAVIRRQLAGNVSQDLASGYQLPEQYSQELDTNFRGAQAARGNSLGTSAGAAEAAFKGKAALDLYQQHLINAGSFLSGPTPEGQIQQIQGVQPDRSSAYTNPNAGFQGQAFGQQAFQNQLALSQLAGSRPNPWAGALVGAGSGAAQGAQYGGGWGSVIGAVAGGVAGYYSSKALKQDIKRVGTSPSGLGIFEFSYKADPSKKFRGVIAEDIQDRHPEAIITQKDGLLRVLYDLIDVDFMEVTF